MTTTHLDATIGWPDAADDRPRLLQWISAFGMHLVSYFAQAADSPYTSGGRDATAVQPCNTDGHCTRVRCCCLACADTQCPYEGSPADFTCPGGVKTFWTCREGTSVIGCGECAGGDSCFDKPWYCSIAYVIN